MIFKEFEKVRIKKTGIIGTIVDISHGNIIVESDTEYPNIPGGYGDKYPLFDCKEEDIERFNDNEGQIETDQTLSEVIRRIDGPTPAGGDYAEIFYFDENGKVVEDKRRAVRAIVHECKTDGTLVFETLAYVNGGPKGNSKKQAMSKD